MIIAWDNLKKAIDVLEENWNFNEHLTTYDIFASQNWTPDTLRKELCRWDAVRPVKVEWDHLNEDLKNKNNILKDIKGNSLGNVTDEDVNIIVCRVKHFDGFKKTKSGPMVFGSKLIHFFNPNLVPVFDLNIREVLEEIEAKIRMGLGKCTLQLDFGNIHGIEKVDKKSYFSKRKDQERINKKVYKNYLYLGIYLLQEAHSNKELANIYNKLSERIRRTNIVNIDSKIFEWCLLGWGYNN